MGLTILLLVHNKAKSMKLFLLGLIGSLLLIVVAALVVSQYSDYRARAETDGWLAQIKPIQVIIEKNAIQQKSLMNAGKNVNKETLQNLDVNFFEITETSILILRGGREGQIIILIPSLTAEQVTWRCIGGPAQAIPSRCTDIH